MADENPTVVTLKDLVGEAQQKTAQLKELRAKGVDLTDDDLATAEGLVTRLKELKPRIEKQRKAIAAMGSDADAFDSFLHAPASGAPEMPADDDDDDDGSPFGRDEPSRKAFQLAGVRRAGHVEVGFDAFHRVKHFYSTGPGVFGQKTWQAIASKSYTEAYCEYFRKGLSEMGRVSRKALEEGLDPQGGYLTPADVLARIISKTATPTRLGGMVQTITTSRDAVVIPRNAYSDTNNIYSTGFRVTNAGEKPADKSARVNDSNLFGTLRIPINTFMLSGVLGNDQLEDSAFDILGWISDKFRETIELHRDNMVANGGGVGEPEGFLMDPGVDGQPDIVASGTNAEPFFTPDALFDITGLVPEQYDENCRFVLNKTQSFRRIRKLKDDNNRYLFGAGQQDDGLANGRPSNLAGYPFTWSGFMPNPGASAYPLAFGDLSGYMAVNRIGLSIQLLRDSRYAEENMTGILGRVRWGGKLVEPWKLKVMQCVAS